MANIQGKSNQNKFKKALSAVEQAGRMSLAKNGFTFGDINQQCGQVVDYSGDWAYLNSTEMSSTDGYRDVHSICKIMETGFKNLNYQGMVAYGNMYNTSIVIKGPRGHNTYGGYTLLDGTIVGVGTGSPDRYHNYDLSCSVKPGEKFDSHWINEHHSNSVTAPCFGFIDVNGPNGPNKEVSCSDGVDTTTEVEKPCVVKAKDITDMFPIVFHDATVEPGSNAAMYVLKNAK